jgi:hypothetical protein
MRCLELNQHLSRADVARQRMSDCIHGRLKVASLLHFTGPEIVPVQKHLRLAVLQNNVAIISFGIHGLSSPAEFRRRANT